MRIEDFVKYLNENYKNHVWESNNKFDSVFTVKNCIRITIEDNYKNLIENENLPEFVILINNKHKIEIYYNSFLREHVRSLYIKITRHLTELEDNTTQKLIDEFLKD